MRSILVRSVVSLALLAPFLAAAPGAVAQPVVPINRDIAGARDHALVPRYEGSFLIGHKVDRFAEVDLPTGPSILVDGQRRFQTQMTVEGPRTRLLYVVPPERSSLEVMRNYQGALAAAGFKPVWSCDRDACGDGPEVLLYFNNPGRQLTADQQMQYAFAYGVVDPRIVIARLDRPQGPVHVMVFAAFQENSANAAAGRRVAVFVDVVETRPMETRMVTVQAPEMARNLGKDGRQAIYGIFFDFDKADIKPESKPQLDEMAKLLRENPGLRVYIVGHTDNQGALEYNTGLSQRRAEAVVRALAGYGIAANRMTPRGVGPLAPVTSNATEEGRGKNRRVELVQQ
ncbi:MAG: DUF4892 domain-containing protein [Rhodospirillales bacterium]|nr:MAG: DUF4892 domain-containing protein [Rhodospirillales bacterium]